MTIETNDKPGEWIATVTGICPIHGATETWGAYGDTAAEARQKLDDTRASLTEGDHELDTWQPQVGRVFELPHRLAEETPSDDMYTSSTAVNAVARANVDMELRRIGDQLRNLASGIVNDMARLLEDLETGRRVNELGIVQGNGSAIDRLCAQRHTLIEIKRTLEGRT